MLKEVNKIRAIKMFREKALNLGDALIDVSTLRGSKTIIGMLGDAGIKFYTDVPVIEKITRFTEDIQIGSLIVFESKDEQILKGEVIDINPDRNCLMVSVRNAMVNINVYYDMKIINII